MSAAQRFAVWLYARPRLRRFFKFGCALWFGGMWAVAVGPFAAADTAGVSTCTDVGWTGLTDIYNVPIACYRVSAVSPLTAAEFSASQQLQGLDLFSPISWVNAIIAGISSGLDNVFGAGIVTTEASGLVFFGALGIWFLKFAITAEWLQWLAAIAQPVVQTLQAMITHYLVMLFCFLALALYAAYHWLIKGKGNGLGIMFGGLGIMALYFVFFNDPVGEMLGPNGVMSIGQYLGFQVAEGAINNGALVPGNGGAPSVDALTKLLCTALLRDQIQMANFGTVIDAYGGCQGAWSAAITSGQSAVNVVQSCGAPPNVYQFAELLGLKNAGELLIVLFVMFWIMVTLLWVGWHVILNGFKAFWRLFVLVVAVPLMVAPGAPRRNGKRQVAGALHNGIEMFASIGGVSVMAIMDGSLLQGGVPGAASAVNSPLGRELFVLAIDLAFAVGYHRTLKHVMNGPGIWGHVHAFQDWNVKRHQRRLAMDFWSTNYFGKSPSGIMRHWHLKRKGRGDDLPTSSQVGYYPKGKKKNEPPGREPPQAKPKGGDTYNTYNYYYGATGGGGQQQTAHHSGGIDPPNGRRRRPSRQQNGNDETAEFRQEPPPRRQQNPPEQPDPQQYNQPDPQQYNQPDPQQYNQPDPQQYNQPDPQQNLPDPQQNLPDPNQNLPDPNQNQPQPQQHEDPPQPSRHEEHEEKHVEKKAARQEEMDNAGTLKRTVMEVDAPVADAGEAVAADPEVLGVFLA